MPPPSLNLFQATLKRALPALSTQLGGRWLPFVIFLILVVLMAWLAAHLSWQFATSPTVAGTSIAPTASAGEENTEGEDNRVARITAAHLFGTAKASGSNAAVVDVPKTSLDLSLLGVAAGNQNIPSQAIIASGSNRNQHTYAVGASLPGGAIVHDILADRVVIAYDGRLESLSLPEPGTSILAANLHFGNGSGNGSRALIAPHPRQFSLPFSPQLRRQIEKHPQTLSHYLRMRPYSANGKLEGYRVYPGSQPELFERSGLQPGDVITRINGIALDSGMGTMKAMAQLRQGHGTVQLNVKRNGQPVHITLHLPGG